MLKKIFTAVVVAVFAVPAVVAASTMWSGEHYTLPVSEAIAGNAYFLGQQEFFAGTIQGDLITAAQQVSVSGKVQKDVLLAGAQLQLAGVISEDARVVGQDVIIGGSVGGDLAAIAGRAYLAIGSSVGGDVLLVGGDATIEGAIAGRARISGGKISINAPIGGGVEIDAASLQLGPAAVIGGDLLYRGPQAPVISPSAVIKGKLTYVRDDFGARRFHGFAAGAGAIAILVLLAMSLVFVSCFFGFFRKQATALTNTAFKGMGRHTVRGLAGLLVGVALSVLIMCTVVGLPVGLFGLLVTVIGVTLANALAGILFGTWVMRVLFKKAGYEPTMHTAIWGTVALRAIGVIPFVGWIAGAFFFLLALGVITESCYHRFWVNR